MDPKINEKNFIKDKEYFLPEITDSGKIGWHTVQRKPTKGMTLETIKAVASLLEQTHTLEELAEHKKNLEMIQKIAIDHAKSSQYSIIRFIKNFLLSKPIEYLVNRKFKNIFSQIEKKQKSLHSFVWQELRPASPAEERTLARSQLENVLQTSGKSLDAETRIKEMGDLLKLLKIDLQEDISESNNENFTKRVALQFQCFEQIADIRSSLKNESLTRDLSDEREKCKKAYKQLVSDIPSFRAAAEIKKELPSKRESFYDVPYELREERLPYMQQNEPKIEIEPLCDTRIKYKHTVHKQPKEKETARKAWKEQWRSVQKALLEGYQRARPLADKNLKITWITGTSTATLVPMMRMQVPEWGGPALIPSGQLIRYGIVPLTGELAYGVLKNGVNISSLSGCEFPFVCAAKKYADTMKTQGIFKVEDELKFINQYCENEKNFSFLFARLQIAVMRLEFAKAQGTEGADAALKEAGELLTKLCKNKPTLPISSQSEKFSSLIDQEIKSKGSTLIAPKLGMIVGVPRSSGKTTYGVVSSIQGEKSCDVIVDTAGTKKTMDISSLQAFSDEKLQQACGSNRAQPFSIKSEKQLLEELIAHTKESSRYKKITDEEAQLLRQPSGLLFGSFVLEHKDLSTVLSDIPGELAAKGPQKLGKTIQVVFVEETDLTRVKEYLRHLPEEAKIHIVSMKALNYFTGAYTSPPPK